MLPWRDALLEASGNLGDVDDALSVEFASDLIRRGKERDGGAFG